MDEPNFGSDRPRTSRSGQRSYWRRSDMRFGGLLLGMGLGGLLDAILLHQILQLHSMLSAKLPLDSLEHVRTNMEWDGYFSLGAWLLTLLGAYVLLATRKFVEAEPEQTPWIFTQQLSGWILVGWGLFNFAEGLVAHHVLGLHHVVERLGLSVWDWSFLLAGLLLMFVGRVVADPDLFSGRSPVSKAAGRRAT